MSSNYVNICRVCMKEDDNFKNLYSPDTDFVEFHVKLFFCVPTVNIDNTKFPQRLCQCCIEDLRIAYKFKQTCLNSTFIINEILKNDEKKNRIEEPPENPKAKTRNRSTESEIETTRDVLEEIHQNAIENIRKYGGDNENGIVSEDTVEETNKTDDHIDIIETYKHDIEEHFEEDHSYFIKTETDLDEVVTSSEMETNVIIEEIHREIKKEVELTDETGDLRESTFDPIFPIITETSSKKRISPDESLFCSLCDLEFGEDDFKKHKYIHRKETTIQCPRCDRYFENPKQIKCFFRHYCVEKNQLKMLACSDCNRFFKSSQALANHKKKHSTAYETFKCAECDIVFKSVQELDWHYRNGVHIQKNTKKIKIYND